VKVTVVLPAYNEAGNVGPLVTELLRVGAGAAVNLHVLVVDDGSVDRTRIELDQLQSRFDRLRVVTHPVNTGLASALKTGIRTACEDGCDAAVFMDCDLSHRPSDLPKLTDALVAGADVVLGSRFIVGGGMRGVPLWRVVISRMGNAVGRKALGLTLTDLTTGYRAFRRHVLEGLQLDEDSFAIQLEAIVKACAAGHRIVEVPIVLETRHHGVSHMRYSAGLFLRYYRLLMKCRQWLRAGRARRVTLSRV
jgi:dolichol-phosphate mannosyltransferase